MSSLGAMLSATALLAVPWILMPRSPVQELHGFKRFCWWINRSYCGFWHHLTIVGPVTLPKDGPALLICNHTCCIDHLLLQAASERVLGFLIAKEYFDYWLFHPFCVWTGCIPVRRDGHDLAATRAALRALQEGKVVPIFPEGHITPTSGRELAEGKSGAAFIALHAKVPVIPAYLRGTPPTNQVVPSLVTPSNVSVRFGPPIDLADLFDDKRPDREKLAEITDRLMGAIRELRDHSDPTQRSANDGERSADGSGALPRLVPAHV